MKTIAERADRAIYEPTDGHPLKAYEVVAFSRGYELGATEQKDIDIEKAKTAFNNACGWLSTYPWYSEVVNEFIKNMEE